MVKRFVCIFTLWTIYFSTTQLFAKADIYIATGVLTIEAVTDEYTRDLMFTLQSSNPELYNSQDFKSAYNTSSDFWDFMKYGSKYWVRC